MELLRRQVECVRHGKRPLRHAGLSVTPAARDRSDEQMAPPRAPDGQAPARPAAVSVLLEVQVPEVQCGVELLITMEDVHRPGRGVLIVDAIAVALDVFVTC